MKGAQTASESLVFLGGIFTPTQKDQIIAQSKGVIQSAADALQQNILRGLAENGCMVTVVNLPFISSYPRYFTQRYFPPTRETLLPGIEVQGQGFSTIVGVKIMSRMVAAFRGLWRVRPQKTTILIYSAHLPFLLAALAYRAVFRRCQLCLILPDLPEFMGDGGLSYRTMKAIDSWLFYALARRVDRFVVLTRAMAERLQLTDDRFVVVEGIAEPTHAVVATTADAEDCIFLYTGTLAARYGILQLLDAFRQVPQAHAQLWICGEGDSRAAVEQACREDDRIRFFGQLTRDEARALQGQASILVNPRQPVGEYTKYSFPSKTMEYMASGRPVLMYALPGMPEEYLPHFTQPIGTDVAGFAAAMTALASRPAAERDHMGSEARRFVLDEKNARTQCAKIVRSIGAA